MEDMQGKGVSVDTVPVWLMARWTQIPVNLEVRVCLLFAPGCGEDSPALDPTAVSWWASPRGPESEADV